jgi:DNA-binding CsgD family transcriptional regulator
LEEQGKSIMQKKKQKNTLSNREMQVLLLVCNDVPSKDIARKLKITASTVSFHRVSIYRKAKARGLASLVRWAIRQRHIKA